MAKLHFIADERKKRRKYKIRWKIACLALALAAIAENIYLFYLN